MKIYVASSWRNQYQPKVVKELEANGHEVYDFKDPDAGFHWSSIDPDWKSWTPQEYVEGLKHPLAKRGFDTDFAAMCWADIFVGVQPFGRSASLEMGWAAGQGKKTILLLDNGEPELMVKMLDYICTDMNQVLEILKGIKE